MAGKTVIEVDDDGAKKSPSAKRARVAYSAHFAGAVASEAFLKSTVGDDIDLKDVVVHLETCIEQVNDGDMSATEAMLVGQAHALQQVFVSLTRRAGVQSNNKLLAAYLNLALKAQAQSRATIQALTDLKYPRQVMINRQTNIANGGPQQVNNGIPDPARAQANATAQNELLEVGDGRTGMDIGAALLAGQKDTDMEAVGGIDRPKDARRKAHSVKKCLQGRPVEKRKGTS